MTLDQMVDALKETVHGFGDAPEGEVLMALGICIGMVCKQIDHYADAAEYEGLDAVNSVAHQVYDTAIIN